MRTVLLFLGSICFFLSSPVWGQSTVDNPDAVAVPRAYAHLARPSRYLTLDVNGLLGFRRYRFFVDDVFRFKSRTDGERYNETLHAVTDTSFSLVMINPIMNRQDYVSFRLSDVKKVYLNRRIPWVTAGSFILPLAGAIFVLADYVNPKTLDGRTGRFVFDSRSLVPGGALVVAGGLCYKLSFPRYKINSNHRLRVLRSL